MTTQSTGKKEEYPLAISSRRMDIQGLRAIAVLAVVIFHSGAPLPGGFVGVDIFFTISGFVITSMLFREWQESNSVNLKNFYLRRIKRLFPALALMVTFTTLISVAVISPFGPQSDVAQTAVGALLLSANLVIVSTTGDYFDTPAQMNPLLHTWSLSIEEQFYLFFPIMLILGWVLSRRGNRYIYSPLLIASLIFLISLALTLIDSNNLVELKSLDRINGFYSPLTRAWEFAAGSILALWLSRRATYPTKNNLGAVGLLGFSLLVTSFLVTNEKTTFPGNLTLLPVAGTILLLYSGSNLSILTTRILSSVPIVRIGDWSYSIYLWHWPLIVFSNLISPQSPLLRIFTIILSIALALFSYYFVEKPIRTNLNKESRELFKIFSIIFVTPLLLAASLEFGARNLWWASWPYEVKKQEARLSFSECTDKPLNLEKCTWGQKSENGKILLIGDSQAFAATEGVVAAGEKLGMRTVVSSRSGCPMSTLNSTGDKPIDCPSWQRDILEYALNSRPAVVVIANRSLGYTNLNKEWRTIIDSDGKVADSRNVLRLYSKGLEGVVELLVKSEIPVVILQNIPEAPSLIPLQPTLLNKMFPSIQPSSFDATESLAQRSHVASEEIRISRLSPLTSVVDPSHVLCNQNICTAKIGNRYLYQDIWHLSEDGSHLLSPLIQESILSLTTP